MQFGEHEATDHPVACEHCLTGYFLIVQALPLL